MRRLLALGAVLVGVFVLLSRGFWWGTGVTEELIPAIEVEAAMLSTESFAQLAMRRFAGNMISDGGAYLVVRLKNGGNTSARGKLRVEIRRNESVDVFVEHLEPNQQAPVVFVQYISRMGVDAGYPRCHWEVLKGK